MSQAFIGQVVLFAGTFAPKNWAFCNGQLLSISQNQALFAILGTFYGGNGSSTFGLPDLRGRVAVSAGQGPGLTNYALGQASGAENVTLIVSQMPTHTHTPLGDATPGNSPSPAGAFWAEGPNPGGHGGVSPSQYTTGTPSNQVPMSGMAIQPQGGNQAHPNIQPLLALNYIICLFGIFPSRN